LSLNTNNVYIYDDGCSIFQWNGSSSTLQHRSKARIFCNILQKAVRNKNANYVEIEESEETDEFWNILNMCGRSLTDL
jgi:hypothetical protein